MRIGKVDLELNQITEYALDSQLTLYGIEEFMDVTELRLNCKGQGSIWISESLIHFDKPTIRVISKVTDKSSSFSIIPLKDRVAGSIYLVTNSGSFRYDIVNNSK